MNKPNVRVISGADLVSILLREIAAAEEKNAEVENISTEERDECDCSTCEIASFCSKNKNEEDSEPVDISAKGLEGFILNLIGSLSRDEDNEECDCEECNGCDDSFDYNFIEMIEDFSEGYAGAFEDEEGNIYKYDHGSKTLLVVTEVSTFPASLTSSLVNSLFSKKGMFISNEKALKLARNGKTINFKVDIFGNEVEGHLTMKDGMPSYKISNNTNVKAETVMLFALMNGIWSI